MRRARRSTASGLTGAIILIGLVLALTIQPFNLPIFFVAIAISIFVGSLGTGNPQRIYGALIGSMWMLILALFFITHLWIVFIVGAALSALLGTFFRSIVGWLVATGTFGLTAQGRPTPPPYYTPPQTQEPYYTPSSTPQPPPQPYQQGYQGPPAQETYQEGDKQYRYPSQQQEYEAPQSQYPQQMPPQ